MRGVIVVILAVFMMAGYMIMAPAAVEGIAEEAKSHPIESGGGEDAVDGIVESLVLWVPLVFMAGIGGFAVAYYIRETLFIGRRAP